jgi:hypothetical protein
MDLQLGRIVLEGGGGGQKTESYELAAYAMARHTRSTPGRRERRATCSSSATSSYPYVSRRQVAAVLGERLAEDVPTPTVSTSSGAASTPTSCCPPRRPTAATPGARHWRGLLGRNVVELADVEHVCEAIALIVGVGEGVIDLRRGVRGPERHRLPCRARHAAGPRAGPAGR